MTIRKYFDMGHDWLVVPKAVENIPIAMVKMQKDDGSYLSVNGLVEQLASEGYVLNIVPVIDERFILVHYGFTYEEDADERAMLKEFLIGMGLVNMRAGKKLNEIDWANMNGNEFGIFSEVEVSDIPQIKGE